MKKLFNVCIILFAGLLGFIYVAQAQNIRLRANANPSTIISKTKYADIYADGNTAVVGSYSARGVFIFDISNPDQPVLKSHYNPGNNQQFLEAIVIGNRGYFGSGNGGGVHIVDLTNIASPQLLGVVNSTTGNGFDSVHEIVIHGNYLIENFNGFTTKTLKVINISNPASPVFIRDINPQEVRWVHAMHVRGNRMFTSGWGNSATTGKTEIYDISNIETQAPVLLGSINSGNAGHSAWTSENGNYLYSCREYATDTPAPPNNDPRGDLRVYDITNPGTPILVKSIKMADLGINGSTPHNPVVKDNFLFVAWYQAGLQVFDISNPADPKRVGQYDTYSLQYVPKPVPDKIAKLVETEPWDVICGNEKLQNLLPNTYDGNWAVFPFLGLDKVLVGDLATGLYIVDTTKLLTPTQNKNLVSDFDGDGKTDYSRFTPSSGAWTVENSSNNSTSTFNFGTNNDKIVPADFDGDNKTDYAVFRAGNWYIWGSLTGFRGFQFGLATDTPVTGDFDADGKADAGVFRESDGTWYIQQSTLGFTALQWGATGDKPIVGDYEGDGKADIGVWRPSNGTFYISQSSSSILLGFPFGTTGDRPVVGNFDNDAKTDFAVYRPSTGFWYAIKSKDNTLFAVPFGISTDVPVQADYDGDGLTDVAVYRPGTLNWYRLNSSNSAFVAKVFGQTGDTASPSSVNPQ